jgi:transposase
VPSDCLSAAVEAVTAAQRQLQALVITPRWCWPLPGQRTRVMLTTAARLRPGGHGDLEVTTALTVLRDLARRSPSLEAEAAEHETAIRSIVRSWRPNFLQLTGAGPSPARV